MSHFSGMKSAKPGVGGLFFEEGNFIVEISATKMVRSRKGDDLYTVEALIEATDSDKMKIGQKPAWMVNLKNDSANGNIKEYLLALAGVNPGSATEEQLESVDEEDAEASVSSDNPTSGVRLGLTTFKKPTRAGGEFTVHRWYPVEDSPLFDGE